jgi:hypothetical protein
MVNPADEKIIFQSGCLNLYLKKNNGRENK